MRGPAVEVDADLRERGAMDLGAGAIVRMELQRRVDAGERAGVDQLDLSVARLLGRRTDEAHLTAKSRPSTPATAIAAPALLLHIRL